MTNEKTLLGWPPNEAPLRPARPAPIKSLTSSTGLAPGGLLINAIQVVIWRTGSSIGGEICHLLNKRLWKLDSWLDAQPDGGKPEVMESNTFENCKILYDRDISLDYRLIPGKIYRM
jgi:hypothetical protein